jgi:hypothetical protein
VFNIQQIGDKVDVSDSRFGYRFDEASSKWVVSDTLKMPTGRSTLREVIPNLLLKNRLLPVVPPSSDVPDPAVLERGPVLLDNVPKVGDSVKVFFQSQSGKTSRNVIGKLLG